MLTNMKTRNSLYTIYSLIKCKFNTSQSEMSPYMTTNCPGDYNSKDYYGERLVNEMKVFRIYHNILVLVYKYILLSPAAFLPILLAFVISQSYILR